MRNAIFSFLLSPLVIATSSAQAPGDSIGYTVSDYGTNGSALHNLINYWDGSLSLARMAAETDDAVDRGTYYSFSGDGGSSWSPLVKIEEDRHGWGSIAQWPEAGGAAVLVSQTGLSVCIDAATGGWRCYETGAGAAIWPRHVTAYPFSLHIIHGNQSPISELHYTRSTDAGQTYDINGNPVFTLAGTMPRPDSYDIASDHSIVAIILCADYENSSGDVFLSTSTDNGDTWDERLIHNVAGPGELPTGEEQFQPDGAVACVFDSSGTLHAVWTNFLGVGDENNDPDIRYDIDAPLTYWSEMTGAVEIPTTVQDTTIQKPPNNFGNLVTQPDIGFDEDGDLYVVYQQQISEQDDSGLFYQHIYATRSIDGGYSWSVPSDVTPGTGFDASFVSMADLADESIHLTYFRDRFAGSAIRGNHETIQVAVIYHAVPVEQITAVNQIPPTPDAFFLSQNYPNPFNPFTSIRFSVPRSGDVTLMIFNLLGEEVATLVHGHREAGTHTITWDASGHPSGVNFYRLETGAFVETKKLVLLR